MSLLAYLAVAGDAIPRKRVAFLLWPDIDEESALANLRRHLAMLDQALPAESMPWVVKDRTTVRWSADDRSNVDAARFETMSADADCFAEAVELYTGDFADGIDDEWVGAHRDRLRDKALGMLEALVERHRGRKNYRAALTYAERAHRLDPLGLLRGDMPPTRAHRHIIEAAGEGESEYTRYDRAIAAEAARWLREEAPSSGKPWALFVSFASPHFPLVAPTEHYRIYDHDEIPMPVAWRPREWAHHPALNLQRRLHCHDEPFDEATIRRAVAAYYGLVSFVDEQVGIVLRALASAGLDESTRVLYTSDHGEALGERGLWMKGSMYESSAGVPLIVRGPGVPAGTANASCASLVDVFPSILEAAGVPRDPSDGDLPGRSLWQLACSGAEPRSVFAEYHAAYSGSASYLVRAGNLKLVYYVQEAPQLFDLESDPDELHDRATDSAYAAALDAMTRRLRAVVDPERTDRAAKADQQRRIAERGGTQAILAGGKAPYTPAPRVQRPQR